MTTFNCPNCGAPITGDLCPYCGTAFIDWSSIDLHKTNWIKIKMDNRIVLVKAMICNLTVTQQDPNPESFYADDRCYTKVYCNPSMQIETVLDCIPFKIPGGNRQDTLCVFLDQSKADLQEAGEMMHRIIQED